MRPSRLAPVALALGMVSLSACGQGSSSLTAPAALDTSLQPTYAFRAGDESFVALYDLHLDPQTLTGTSALRPGRRTQAQPPQAISYDLDIENFLRPDSFELISVARDGDGDLEVGFIHRHPFRAPDFTAAITGQNRADLGYTGRAVILAEESNQTFFGGSIETDPTLVKQPDGFVNPGDLLATVGLTNNTFPYVLLADDGEDNRIGEPNGGPTGNYATAAGGWQRANAGTNNTSWTGYDYVHGGQEVRNTLSLYVDALGGPIDLAVAILIKYTDPRGQGGRTLRFPPATVNVTQFAYRLPYAALDCSHVTLTNGPIVIENTVGSLATLSVSVRDWDSGATEAADADLSDESDVALIEPGAAGAPTVELDASFLNASLVSFTENTGGTGLPGSELAFEGTLANSLGTAAPGNYHGLLRVTDPSEDVDDDAYRFGVDPVTITPSAARAIEPVTYLAIPITVEVGLEPPVVTGVTPLSGAPSATVTFDATTTGDPATSWAWDFGTWGNPTTSTDENPMIQVPATLGPYNGSVIATNAAGSSAPFNFTFTVSNPWPPSPPTPPDTTPGSKGWYPAIVTYAGRPVITAFDMTGGVSVLKMYIGNIAEPQGTADWTSFAIPATQYTGAAGDTGQSMVVYNGRLVIAFKDDSLDDLRIAIATVTEPTLPTATDWTVHTIDSAGDVGRDSKVVVHNNLLAISYWAAPTADDLKLAQATVPLPASTTDWAIHVVDGATSNTGTWTGLISFDDGVSGPRLWASCRMFVAPNRCRVSRATVLTPASSTDWIHMDVEPGGASGRWTSLTACTIAGQPRVAVSYCDFNTNGLDVAIAQTAAPTTSTDWLVINAINTVPMTSPGAWGTEIQEIQGRLTVVWNNAISPNDTVVLARATSDNPTLPSHWTIETVGATPGVDTGFYPKMTVLSTGNIGVAWRHGTNFIGNPGTIYYASRAYNF